MIQMTLSIMASHENAIPREIIIFTWPIGIPKDHLLKLHARNGEKCVYIITISTREMKTH